MLSMTRSPAEDPELTQAAEALTEAVIVVLETALTRIARADWRDGSDRLEIMCAALPPMLAALRATGAPPD